MKFRRQRFQRGTLRKVARANKQWSWEYRYQDPTTGKRKSMFISTEKFPTQVESSVIWKLLCSNSIPITLL